MLASAMVSAILEAADRRARIAIEQLLPKVRYGVVTVVDATNKLATVDLPGPGAASPGFIFEARSSPAVGELVRVVMLPTGDRYIDASFGPLRLTDTGDVTLASTLHALQIGPSSGPNLALDSNEIMARSNGAAAILALQNDGGPLWVNGLVLNNIVGMHHAPDSGDLLVTTTAQTVPGLTITQTATAGETWLVDWFGQMRYISIADAETAQFTLYLDGSVVAGSGVQQSSPGAAMDKRLAFAGAWLLTPTAAAHTLTLRAHRSGTASSIFVDADNYLRLIRIRATA